MYPYYPQSSMTMNSMPQNLNPYQNRIDPLQGANSQRLEIIRVNGENGARMFNLPPNSSILLLDENEPIVWLAQTDGAGYKTISSYTITPYQQPAAVDTKSLEARIARLEEIINGKSDNGSSEQKQSKSNKQSN